MSPLILLGPQRLQPSVADACRQLGVEGDVAAITAGWQEREGETEELEEHLGLRVIDLRLHQRAEEVFELDVRLFEASRECQDRLRKMQRLYAYRLDFAIEPAYELLRREGDPELLEPERKAAIAALRRLDEEHLRRVAGVHRDFERRCRRRRRAAVKKHREEIAADLERSAALVVAGGHVAVLLDRLRLFGVADLVSGKPILAWSAGAMALGERIVLFHDSPPWGAGNAEVLETGLGLYQGLLPLPDARHRLRLEDPARVALLSRRFSPLLCLALDDGDAVTEGEDGWRPVSGGRRLTPAGAVVDLGAA